jgi:HNH endonuclease
VLSPRRQCRTRLSARYALRLVKQRLHQASLRDVVLTVYDHRCAISNLPDDHLLDAAHIMADGDELLGQAVVSNGIALSKIHHAAFDNHLIGIDPDGRAHVSNRLLKPHDGPLLEQSLQAAAGALIRLPRGKQYHPDRDRLAARSSCSNAPHSAGQSSIWADHEQRGGELQSGTPPNWPHCIRRASPMTAAKMPTAAPDIAADAARATGIGEIRINT